MNSEYILGPNKYKFSINENFPKCERVGIFMSGGLESTLLAKISFMIYGKQNVELVYSDSMFSGQHEDINKNIINNVETGSRNLDKVAYYISVDMDLHYRDRKEFVVSHAKKVCDTYNLDYLFFGFTKLFFEVEPFKNESLTLQDIVNLAYAHPTKYYDTIKEFHLDTKEYIQYLKDIDIPSELYPILRGSSDVLKSPFKDLNKKEVIDLYRQLDLLDLSYKTRSCIMETVLTENKHCGKCFNCQQRYDGYTWAGVEDKTEYVSSTIIERHNRLERIRNELYN